MDIVGIFAFVAALVLATRFGCSDLFDFDPEIERALHAHCEDPHKHLKEFQVVCSTPLRPEGITEDHIRLRAFPFSLQGAAKDWLYYLELNFVTTWNDLKRVFLERYFSASRAASIRKDICGIRQGNKSLAEYWERFKQLVSSCPQYQITKQLLIQYFYEGLSPMDRNILDAASGGALVDKTPVTAKALIENMSLNSQQFATRNNSMVKTKGVNDIQQAQGSNQLPAQTVVNPKGPNANVSEISLRFGKVIEPAPEKNKKILEVTPEPSSVVIETESSVVVETEKEKEKEYVRPIPFPHRILKIKRTDDGDKEREILDVFRKVAVNIPLLDVIKQVPKYAKFLKDLCTSKRRLKGNERVNLGRNISSLIHPKHSPEKATVSSLNQAIPQKCKDPGTFAIPCTIGDSKFKNCMLDLGAGINFMPTSVYTNLDLGPLQHTGLIIQLANRSNARPIGLVEDVLVQVNDLIFPADFYILNIIVFT
ncbi:uncharacterized protein LOC127103049 [Lathyrus oleraceus]|uniref:uncharacterized protein LOC127103049 n=1 Tax=Pisum sativum TaxID=3888 RepID=UPI0021CDFC37|nr:uncharacterized protein LOC127103049 [Pisum sativum]